jgi:glycosyltransferase involved in cell wall biosynthesis
MSARLSACIIARDEERRIVPCLDSLTWCDEILVVDSGSTDQTREVVAQRGARVIRRAWPGYAEQKDYAVRQAAYDWVLCIDADERVSPELRREIERLRADGFAHGVGWEMPRLTWYLGVWIRHGTWYPDWSLRLFDRRRGRWVRHPDHEVHERVELQGRPARLRADLLHYPYATLSDHLQAIDHYTTLIAEGLHRKGHRAGVSALVLRPLWEFHRFYLLKRGILDGWRGLLLAFLHAHYVRMKYAKLLATQRGDTPPPL